MILNIEKSNIKNVETSIIFEILMRGNVTENNILF